MTTADASDSQISPECYSLLERTGKVCNGVASCLSASGRWSWEGGRSSGLRTAPPYGVASNDPYYPIVAAPGQCSFDSE